MIEQVYGWFDRKPWRGGEDSIYVCRSGRSDLGQTVRCRRARTARSPPRRRRSATRRRRSGSSRRRRARPRPGSPSRSAPSRNATRPDRSTDASGSPPCATSATRALVTPSYLSHGQAARARSSRRSRAAPSATSGRRSPPRARPPRRTPRPCGSACRRCRGRRPARARASRRAPPTPADRRGGRRRSRAAGAARSRRPRAASARRPRPPRAGRPARRSAAATASSPSTKNSPSLSRQRLSCSLRTSFRRSLSFEVITRPTPATRRGSRRRRAARRAPVRVALELERIAVVVGRTARGDEGERLVARRGVHRRVQPFERARVEVHRRRRLEDHELRAFAPVAEQRRQRLDVVAAQELRRVVAHDVDRAPQPLEPLRLVGPDERLRAGARRRRS